MKPKLEFIYSSIYQEVIHSPYLESEKYDYEKYEDFVKDYISKIKDIWKNIEKEVFNYVEEISNLNWKEDSIKLYVIKRSFFLAFSDPLTIPIELDIGEKVITLTHERFIDMLIHELIHNLFIQNKEKIGKYFTTFLPKKYEKESLVTQAHILLHALHKKIFLKLFDKKRLDLEIEMNAYYPDYKRSWEIINEIGEDKIIQEFKDYIGLPKAKE